MCDHEKEQGNARGKHEPDGQEVHVSELEAEYSPALHCVQEEEFEEE